MKRDVKALFFIQATLDESIFHKLILEGSTLLDNMEKNAKALLFIHQELDESIFPKIITRESDKGILGISISKS